MKAADGDAVIDLGVPSEDAGQKMPSRPALRRRLRPLLAALCAAVTIASTTAAAAPAPLPPWQRLTTIAVPASQSSFAFLADLLLVPEPQSGALIAYELGGGQVRWRAELQLDRLSAAEEAAGVIVASGGRRDDAAPTARARTYGVDPATGSVRWERAGSLSTVTPSGDRVILGEYGGSVVLSAVDVHSGAVLWRFDAGPEASLDWGSGPNLDRFVRSRPDSYLVTRRDGRLADLSLASGSATELGHLPATMTIVDSDARTIISAVGYNPGRNPPDGPQVVVVAAYDRVTLRELWRRSEPDGTMLRLCVSLLCRYGQRSTAALEPRTGRPVWQTDFQPQGLWPRRSGDLLIASDQTGLGNILIDPVTGATRATLGHWRALGRLGDALLVYMPNGNGTDQRTWIGRIPATGEPVVRPMGLFGPNGAAVSDCQLRGAWLACMGLNQVLVVRLPS